ncbi:MAG: sensor histidine kinase [Flavobacteriales bacterium]
MNFIRSFFIILFFAPVSLICNERDLDSLIEKSVQLILNEEPDSLIITLKRLRKETLGKELDSLLSIRQISLAEQIKIEENKIEIIKSKSQMQSVVLLLICLFSFIYLIYYTDKVNRNKQLKKIKAASKISKYESNIRKQISEKLHDDIGGSIIALKMKFINKEGMKNEVQLLSNIYEKVRKISSDLDVQHKFSQTIEDGIDILVNEMCNGFDKKNINVFPDGINKITDKVLIENVIMTTKELITNVIKHSKANEISIDVSLIDNHINIIVQDNGSGMKNQNNFGQGLKSIQNRAILYEGTFDIDSNNSGTTANVKFLIT